MFTVVVNFLLPASSGSKNVVTEGQMDEIINADEWLRGSS